MDSEPVHEQKWYLVDDRKRQYENTDFQLLPVTVRFVELPNGNKGIDFEECISVISKITEIESLRLNSSLGKIEKWSLESCEIL